MFNSINLPEMFEGASWARPQVFQVQQSAASAGPPQLAPRRCLDMTALQADIAQRTIIELAE